jgi:hypothetical protein
VALTTTPSTTSPPAFGESPAPGRIIALGASNLTRGIHTVVSAAHQAWGPQVEVLAALGHGRSYGAHSRFLARRLPGILECGLWRALEARAPLPARALVTDIGNDILYGFSVQQTLEWVEESLLRLRRLTDDVTVTDLPLDSIRRLSNGSFLAFRSVLVPSCRLSFRTVLERAEAIDAGLRDLAIARGARLFHLKPDWYGLDPIHIRPGLWSEAWREILGIPPGTTAERRSRLGAARLYLMRPERRWLFGIEQFTPQDGMTLASGATVRLY